MAIKPKTTPVKINIYLTLVIRYLPIWLPVFLIIVFIALVGWPLSLKLISITQETLKKQSDMTTATRSKTDVAKMKEDLEVFRKKVDEFEKKLPTRMKNTLLTETLQEITSRSKVKFDALEPQSIKRYKLEETKDIFVELPVRVKLSCGYYEMIDFLQKIETANQFMKITDLRIKSNPSSDWEHAVEFTIGAYSKEDSGE